MYSISPAYRCGPVPLSAGAAVQNQSTRQSPSIPVNHERLIVNHQPTDALPSNTPFSTPSTSNGKQKHFPAIKRLPFTVMWQVQI